MSIVIDKSKCIGCKKCRNVCPGSLIKTDENGKAYIKYPKNSNCQRWIKRETSRRIRSCRNAPAKGNFYRRLFDYWWTLY